MLIPGRLVPVCPTHVPPAIPPRPGLYDPAVIAAAFEQLWPLVEGWLETVYDAPGRDELRAALQKEMASPLNEDGFKLAKRLEEEFLFEGDSDLVSALDCAIPYRNQAYSAAVMAWVTAHGPIPQPFHLGTMVRIERLGVLEEGVIFQLQETTAEYLIHIESDGILKGHDLFIPFDGTRELWPEAISWEKLEGDGGEISLRLVTPAGQVASVRLVEVPTEDRYLWEWGVVGEVGGEVACGWAQWPETAQAEAWLVLRARWGTT